MASKGLDTSGIHLWLVLWRATRAVESHAVKSIEGLGMCRSDFGVLEAILHKGPLPVHALGEKVLLTSGSITAAVDRLERRGLVNRRGDASDRRTRIVHLTATGIRLIRKLFAGHARDMEEVSAAFTNDQRADLIRALVKLGKHAERMEEERREKRRSAK